MKIHPSTGTTVVIVSSTEEARVVRSGRIAGMGSGVTATFRPDLPPLEENERVFVLSRIASQKMIADAYYLGSSDGADFFRLTGAWRPADNRLDPRLEAMLPVEVRPRSTRVTVPGFVRDLSFGGAAIDIEEGAISGEVEVIMRFGGFSASLPATVAGEVRIATGVRYRIEFRELNRPQLGFLRHILADLAEASGWELAS